MLRETLAIRVTRILFLEVPAVREDDPTKGVGSLSRVNRTAEAVTQETRKISRVVNVRVRQYHGVDAGGRDRERSPVAQAQRF